MGYEAYTQARDAGLRNGERQRAEQEQERLRRLSMDAGNAFADGNIGGAAETLLRGGAVREGLQVRADQQRQTEAAQERQQAALSAAAAGLIYIPEAERADVFQSRVAPFLAAEGVPQELINQITPEHLSDGGLRAFITQMGGEAPSPFANDRTGPNGSILRGDPVTGEYGTAYAAPFDPRAGASPGYMWTDESRTRQVFIPGGPQDPSVAGARAAATRAPRRGRSGGGGGSRPSGGSAPAAPPRTFQSGGIKWD